MAEPARPRTPAAVTAGGAGCVGLGVAGWAAGWPAGPCAGLVGLLLHPRLRDLATQRRRPVPVGRLAGWTGNRRCATQPRSAAATAHLRRGGAKCCAWHRRRPDGWVSGRARPGLADRSALGDAVREPTGGGTRLRGAATPGAAV